MDKGILIALILAGAQVICGFFVWLNTKLNNKTNNLKEEISQLNEKLGKKEERLKKFAKQIYFLRFVEESVYGELVKTNTDYTIKGVKQKIHGTIAEMINVKYKSMDDEIKELIDACQSISPIDISDSYIK